MSDKDEDLNDSASVEEIEVNAVEIKSKAVKRKRTSNVWNEFERIEKNEKEVDAKCKHCHKMLKGKSSSGTSHLRKHLSRHCQIYKTKQSTMNQSDVIIRYGEVDRDFKHGPSEVEWENAKKCCRVS
ncbi:hypothetical protein GIB67_025848 [Kingdonia uniflora]|uniref:BED-type domain-containing protein n=1 Tax=Kingdonia uniflora TaxID=39325 RepID=A0A7J7PC75_9MAGN|nr:hypothetical protein GIB67_025848 [Kingdonia uniflora]